MTNYIDDDRDEAEDPALAELSSVSVQRVPPAVVEPWNDPNYGGMAEVADAGESRTEMTRAGSNPAPTTITPAPIGPPQLDALQQKAIDDCRDHLYTNISGTAGVGKTFVAKEIQKRYPGVLLCATTGIASVNLGEGTTINAALKYFNTADLRTKHVAGKLKQMINYLRKSGVRRLLIDEKSMMAGEQLTHLTRAVRESNEHGIYALENVGQVETEVPDDAAGAADRPQRTKREEPPPLGITLVGDFGQLPPVPDEEEYKDPKTGDRKWRKLPVQFCFDSPEWELYAQHTTRLETIYRQDAKDFVAALHAIRRGDVVEALRFFTPDRFSDTQDDRFDGSTVFAKNDQVDRYNQLRLDQLMTPKMIARSIRQGEQRPDWKLIPETLVLKEGALVMLLANRRITDKKSHRYGELIYANGDLATLVGKDEHGAWVVKLYRNGKREIVYPVTRENQIALMPGRRKQIKAEVKAQLEAEGYRADFVPDTDDDDEELSYLRVEEPAAAADAAVDWDKRARDRAAKERFRERLAERISDDGAGKFEIIGTITYQPVRAAYGCTVHKTQGLTLDRVQVNIMDWFFKQPGMLFVALSRARTAEGLRIVGDQQTFIERCRVEPRVVPWL